MASTLSPKQRNAALLIASGHTHRNAAAALKVSPQTMSDWVGRADFRNYVDELLAQAEQSTATALTGLRLRAVERLGELLESKSPGIALRAVQTALDLTTANARTPQPPQVDAAWGAILGVLSGEAHKSVPKPP